jgi:hypothetical protein
MRRPALIVGIDTEEEGLWSGGYRAEGNSCRNIEHLPRLHAICARLRVKPTYLVDHPVATNSAACSILRELAASGGAEIGAHLHPWATPPFRPDGTRPEQTYPNKLPPVWQLEKLRQLRDAIVLGLHVVPRAYRAGRWGFDRSTVPVLLALGFTVDSSVTPLWWDPERGGPSFVEASLSPHRLAEGLMEVPVSCGFVGQHAAGWERWVRRVAPLPGLRRVMVGLGYCSLQPEVYPLEAMCALADQLMERELPVLNIAFHSSTAVAGATPFARDRADLDRFAGRLEGLLEHLLGRWQATPLGLSEVPGYLAPESADSKKRTYRPATASSE